MAKEIEPVHLSQEAETGDYFLVYDTEKGLRLDIRYEGETLWMTQAQIAELFGVDRSVITKHIANIYNEGELDREPTSAKIAQVRSEGERRVNRQVEYYNLDMFRRWATGILVQFAAKGFVVDSPRLKQPENFSRIKELREIIRDIRADEANIYRELKEICAMCRDYDGSAQMARDFFQKTQAKLIYAAVSHTPSEVVYERADSSAENMGLQSWPRDNIRKSDVTVSKNYLAEPEIRELNRLTTILLDIFEQQLERGRILVMRDAAELLDRQLKGLEFPILRGGGSISADRAKQKALAEYAEFDHMRKEKRYKEADANIARLAKTAIAELAKEDKSLPKRPKKT